MTETPTTPMTLTALDCTALRGATSWVVRLNGDTAQLELTRKAWTNVPGYGRTSVEVTHTIAGNAGTIVEGIFMEMYASGSWQALARLVRPGDVLKFYASDDNSNAYLRAASIAPGALDEQYHRQGYPRLYVDELRVNVDRKGRRLVDGLLLTYSICPDNTARAVRRRRSEVA